MQHACAGWQAAPAVVCMLTSRIDAANPGISGDRSAEKMESGSHLQARYRVGSGGAAGGSNVPGEVAARVAGLPGGSLQQRAGRRLYPLGGRDGLPAPLTAGLAVGRRESK
jgi:hypothetical protein